MDLPPGEGRAPGTLPKSIGRYRITERIGRGAMGVVYAAIDAQLDRRVAVKLMLADFDQDPEIRERFYREARITGQLAHRNIVTVFDLGEERNRPYIVMELLEGLPLAEHMQAGGSQTLDEKLDLMIQVCEGLQNAHRCGVIHRDLKPSNLFVQKDGSVKILDFGVARLAASNLTASGFLVGTPEYMSPEQPQGRPVDARSDVYSAASVFYLNLTGRSSTRVRRPWHRRRRPRRSAAC
jgi:serine/threonine protein kinase